MADKILIELEQTDTRFDGDPIHVVEDDDGELWVVAFNDTGYNCTRVLLHDVLVGLASSHNDKFWALVQEVISSTTNR